MAYASRSISDGTQEGNQRGTLLTVLLAHAQSACLGDPGPPVHPGMLLLPTTGWDLPHPQSRQAWPQANLVETGL